MAKTSISTLSRIGINSGTDIKGNKVATPIEKFVQDWLQELKTGVNEKGNTEKFWSSLISIIQEIYKDSGNPYIQNFNKTTGVRYEYPIRDNIAGKFYYADGYIEQSKVLIEQKNSSINLDTSLVQSDGSYKTAYEQARTYNEALPANKKCYWIITCNFNEIRIYDENNKRPEPTKVIRLAELSERLEELKFILLPTEEQERTIEREELTCKVGLIVGELRQKLYTKYEETLKGCWSWDDLNKLCVRLIFCAFADRFKIFGLGKFSEFLDSYKDAKRSGSLHTSLGKLFETLDTPKEERDLNLEDEYTGFPYVNGGLFKDHIKIPKFDYQMVKYIVEDLCEKPKWEHIEPAIFGSIFEGTLSKEYRREQGIHYTSIENIERVIEPLFLDELWNKYTVITRKENIQERIDALIELRKHIGSLVFLDPACGSGNFLTVTYSKLRELELEIIKSIESSLKEANLDSDLTSKDIEPRVKLSNFYGIEINKFACDVARTALWMVKVLRDEDLRKEYKLTGIPSLPLKSTGNIVNENSLRVDWESIVPKDKLSYIIGNPPFVGMIGPHSSTCDRDRDMLYGNSKVKGYKRLDYVCCFFLKAIKYIQSSEIKMAFVTTDSITYGEYVNTFWNKVLAENNLKCYLIFAYKPFMWDSQSYDKAQVSVSILGLSFNKPTEAVLYDNEGWYQEGEELNFYLKFAKNTFIERLDTQISGYCKGYCMDRADDGKHLRYTEDISKLPEWKQKLLKPMVSAIGLVNRTSQYCFWLKDTTEDSWDDDIKLRVAYVRYFRSVHVSMKNLVNIPHLFSRNQKLVENCMLVPLSQTIKDHLVIKYYDHEVYSDNSMVCIPGDHYLYGILSSKLFQIWVSFVGGLQYGTIITTDPYAYNTLPIPKDIKDPELLKHSELRHNLLFDKYKDVNLNKLLKDAIPSDVQDCLDKLDHTVYRIYGFIHDDSSLYSDDEVLSSLLNMYKERVDSLNHQ